MYRATSAKLVSPQALTTERIIMTRDANNGRGWVAATYRLRDGSKGRALVSPPYRDELRKEGRLVADHGDEDIVNSQGNFNPWNKR
jgi:hypothetical protein